MRSRRIKSNIVPPPAHRPQRKRSLDGAPVDEPPEVIALETLAVIDHSCKVPDHFFKAGPFKGELGGSIRVDDDELQTMLVNVGEFSTKAGGSAANTARGLSAGFDIRTSLISAVGKDEWGALFTSSMHRAGVDTSGTIVREGTFICISIRAIRLTACFIFRSRRSNRPMRLPGR
jgi:hypothetical protein